MDNTFLQRRKRLRNGVLVVHVVASVAWVGVDLALLALLSMTITTSDGAVAAAGVRAVAVVIPATVPALALLMVTSGVLLGLGTKWGLLKYTWVAWKLFIGVVLTVLVGVLLLPTALTLDVPDATRSADQVRAGVTLPDLLAPPIVSGIALITAVVLSVYKPGGRLRLRTAQPATALRRDPRRPRADRPSDASRPDRTHTSPPRPPRRVPLPR